MMHTGVAPVFVLLLALGASASSIMPPPKNDSPEKKSAEPAVMAKKAEPIVAKKAEPIVEKKKVEPVPAAFVAKEAEPSELAKKLGMTAAEEQKEREHIRNFLNEQFKGAKERREKQDAMETAAAERLNALKDGGKAWNEKANEIGKHQAVAFDPIFGIPVVVQSSDDDDASPMMDTFVDVGNPYLDDDELPMSLKEAKPMVGAKAKDAKAEDAKKAPAQESGLVRAFRGSTSSGLNDQGKMVTRSRTVTEHTDSKGKTQVKETACEGKDCTTKETTMAKGTDAAKELNKAPALTVDNFANALVQSLTGLRDFSQQVDGLSQKSNSPYDPALLFDPLELEAEQAATPQQDQIVGYRLVPVYASELSGDVRNFRGAAPSSFAPAQSLVQEVPVTMSQSVSRGPHGEQIQKTTECQGDLCQTRTVVMTPASDEEIKTAKDEQESYDRDRKEKFIALLKAAKAQREAREKAQEEAAFKQAALFERPRQPIYHLGSIPVQMQFAMRPQASTPQANFLKRSVAPKTYPFSFMELAAVPSRTQTK